MSDDLNKLMTKLKDNKAETTKAETPEEEKPTEVTETPKVETPAEVPQAEDPDAIIDEDFDKVEETPTEEEKVEESEPIPAKTGGEQSTENEVAILQNDGVFRRELLLILGELVKVHKVNTQTLIDLKVIAGGKDDKGK